MIIHYDAKLKPLSRQLRKSTTIAERKLWSKLRGKQISGKKFLRQKPIDKYIVDFYCPEARLAIELDGGQHYRSEGIKKDETRTKRLTELGLKILRFSDRDVLTNIQGVWQVIDKALKEQG